MSFTPASRIDLIVALAIKNQTYPSKNNFPAFVKQVLAAKCQVTPQTATNDLKTLISAWSADKWRSIIRGNPYNITEAEVSAWTAAWRSETCLL